MLGLGRTAETGPGQTRAARRASPRDLLITARPVQWVKNLFVLAPVVFAQRLRDPEDVLLSAAAFWLFCLLASGVYFINDALDAPRDRLHPVKSRRPVAAGRLGRGTALGIGAASMSAAVALGGLISPGTAAVLGIYAALNLLYSWRLKSVGMLDVIVIAVGFVLRAVAGAVAIHVAFSVWLLLCTFFLAMLLAAAKRRSEMAALGAGAEATRPSLVPLNGSFLDSVLTAAAAATLVSYALYTVSAETVAKFGGKGLIVTMPFVAYGVIRYLQLVYTGTSTENPTAVVLRDWGMRLTIVSWVGCAILVIYVFRASLGGLLE